MKFYQSIIITFAVATSLVACSQEEQSTPTPKPTVSIEAEVENPDPTNTPEPTKQPTTTASPNEAGDQEERANEPNTSLGEGDFPMASIVNDEGGPVTITGEVEYTNPFFTMGVAEPVVILEDQAGFVDRNESFLMPLESQTLGQITSDFFDSPFSYSIALPIEPKGTLRDVDNDGEEDLGIQVFAIAYWTNTFGDPFLEERDLSGGGWSTAYASTLVSDDANTEREIIGGKLLIYAPDDQQGFPSAFGDDGLLFTGDDPIIGIPQGYTIVDLDTEPFTFDRSVSPVVDLIEPEGTALDDYSELGYVEAFNAFVDQLSKEYAFTEYKGIDWEALREEFLPRFQAAESADNVLVYRRALRDFAWSIPDGHISGPQIIEDFREATAGGLGIAIRELDDGRTIVNFLAENSPAADAGILYGAEVLTINGLDVGEAISQTVAHSGPFSTDHYKRLQQMRYASRFPLDTEVDISWQNPGNETIESATLIAVPESASFAFSSFNVGRDAFDQPVEYDLLEDGIGYVQIYSFSDNELLTVQLWERLIRNLNDSQVPGLIVDMRQNGGGSGFLADQMAAYFFNESFVLGNTGRYDEDLDDFYFDSRSEERFYLPAEELRYKGEVAVIVGPNCASACEFFSYDMTIDDRAVIVGHYPTAGLGGSVKDVAMPEGEMFRFTQGRAVDSEGQIHIEGIGVPPSLDVPINEETLLDDGDPLLEAAIQHIKSAIEGEVVDGGDIELGDQVTQNLEADTRIRYRLPLAEGDIFSLELESSEFAPILSLYDEQLNLLGTTAGELEAIIEELEAPFDLILIIEVSAEDGNEGGEFTLNVQNGN